MTLGHLCYVSFVQEELQRLKLQRRSAKERRAAEAVKETKKRWAYELVLEMRKGAHGCNGLRLAAPLPHLTGVSKSIWTLN